MAQRQIKALTLLETIVVVTIILVVAAIAFPVFFAAKRKSKETISVSNLRQLFIAMDLYRTDHDGQGNYGHHTGMGLPNAFDASEPGWGFDIGSQELLKSGCPLHPTDAIPQQPDAPGWIIYNVYDDERPAEPTFAEFANRQRENLVVFQDVNCADRNIDLMNPVSLKRILGITLSGSLRIESRSGFPYSLSWWD